MAMVSVIEKFLVVVSVLTLVPGAFSIAPEPNVPGLLPFEPGKEPRNCRSIITKVPGCLSEIYASIYSDKLVIISSTCCDAIDKVRRTNCNPKLFPPSTPRIPPVSTKSCPALGELLIRNNAGTGIPGLLPPKIDSEIAKCWSGLTGIVGCVFDIFEALISGKFGSIGGDCCKAIVKLEDSCWSVMFPFQPSFPPLLKSFCALKPSGAV